MLIPDPAFSLYFKNQSTKDFNRNLFNKLISLPWVCIEGDFLDLQFNSIVKYFNKSGGIL
ncbi:hypothetical protein J14TS2_48890 [Bacillus sp. J14TS2]|nr:hypothetical protein J14TS2_48890 [Bacillus sp. J14TS2]